MCSMRHVSAKGVNCAVCGSGIAYESQFVFVSCTASASSIVSVCKIACTSKSIVRFILLIRSFAISTS